VIEERTVWRLHGSIRLVVEHWKGSWILYGLGVAETRWLVNYNSG
jgi:hypothetical protein